jgi:oligoendopeptidase F
MSSAQAVPARGDLPVERTWNLGLIYADQAAWEAEVAAIEALAAELALLAGTLMQGAAQLLLALQLRDGIAERLNKVYVYASHGRDADGNDPTAQGLAERAGAFTARIAAMLSFIEPEMLTIDETTLRAWLDDHAALALYRRQIERLLRQRAHVRSAEVEQVLAELSDVIGSPYNVFETFTNSDMIMPSITLPDGSVVQLSHGRYGRFLEHPDRTVREATFRQYYAAYAPYRNTLATTLSATVRAAVTGARLRGYGSALEGALTPNEIPSEVYRTLISTVEANLSAFHRYLEVRKQLMGLDELHFFDLYVQPVADVERSFGYDEAVTAMRAAFAPLGSEYLAELEQAFSGRWIDVYENKGKRSGAYSGGAYGTPAFILLNYQDRLNDVFTLAHELGHSMHSALTRKTQPFTYGDYTIFVAEVASTLNEALLTDHLLATSDDVALKRRLIVQQLEEVRGTLFRQTMFAAFELAIHEMAERGEPLTDAALSAVYFELVKKWHGPALTVDAELAFEWARIPHFYYNFYVYQYATGLSAALALHRGIVQEGAPAVERYLNFLRSGSSQTPIDLLKLAGVDMTSAAPIQAAIDHFRELTEELAVLR